MRIDLLKEYRRMSRMEETKKEKGRRRVRRGERVRTQSALRGITLALIQTIIEARDRYSRFDSPLIARDNTIN